MPAPILSHRGGGTPYRKMADPFHQSSSGDPPCQLYLTRGIEFRTWSLGYLKQVPAEVQGPRTTPSAEARRSLANPRPRRSKRLIPVDPAGARPRSRARLEGHLPNPDLHPAQGPRRTIGDIFLMGLQMVYHKVQVSAAKMRGKPATLGQNPTPPPNSPPTNPPPHPPPPPPPPPPHPLPPHLPTQRPIFYLPLTPGRVPVHFSSTPALPPPYSPPHPPPHHFQGYGH